MTMPKWRPTPSRWTMRKKGAAAVAVVGGLAVFAIKMLSFIMSNSVALLSDALESIVNILASVMMLLSVYISDKPADETHNYGHQKVEDISSGFEGVLILVAAGFIAITALGRLFEPVALVQLDLAIILSVLATGINGALSLMLSRTARASGSAALEGDAKHLLSDVISSVGVWTGLIIAQVTGWLMMDAILALVVAVLITRMGGRILYASLGRLMDSSCVEEERIIKGVLDGLTPPIIEYHDLKTRRQGNNILAEVHLTVEDDLSVRKAHDIVDSFEQSVLAEAPHVILTVHVDPASEMEAQKPVE
ncbi:MAG: cation diffusion facilitator family transporter [Candidatus Thorarchaeota archaeon]|nr:MAG: cation-efflux pump [Candidatus Thorarchaeota archaeon]